MMPVVASIAETLMSKAAVAEIVFVAVLADVNGGGGGKGSYNK